TPRVLERPRSWAVLDIGRGVEDLEDPVCRRQRARDLPDDEPESARRADEASEVIIEGDDRPHRERSVDGKATAVPDDDHAAQGSDADHHRNAHRLDTAEL